MDYDGKFDYVVYQNKKIRKNRKFCVRYWLL